jgi:hypothetical protein
MKLKVLSLNIWDGGKLLDDLTERDMFDARYYNRSHRLL